MTDLPEFLLARIAEDEEAAYHAQGLLGMVTPWHRVQVLRERGLTRADAQHVERWSAARVLAECKTKRQIVEDLQAELANQHDPEPTTLQLAERTLLALALPYADHPDYREEWRP